MNKALENTYIVRRVIKASAAYLLYFAIAALHPIKKGKIVFSAFEGGGYGCNCKYIAEGIIRNKEISHDYDMYWLVNDIGKEFPREIKPVKNNLISRAYHLSTAEIWVDNARKNLGTRKRKGQLYIQTWHGQIGVKPVGRLRGDSFSKIAEIVTKYDARIEDYFLINSRYAYDIFRKSFYGENLVKTGSPRCDVLINDKGRLYGIIREKLGIPSDARFFIYAPTFRGGSQSTNRMVEAGKISLDLNNLSEAFAQRFGGKWHAVIRLHPQLAIHHVSEHLVEKRGKGILDISLEDDLYEYLAGADAFISDYSSAQADAAVMGIPVFTYADDMDEYEDDRGELLCKLEDFPYPVAYDSDELIKNIIEFDDEAYRSRLEEFFKKIEILEDGKATERVINIINKHRGICADR